MRNRPNSYHQQSDARAPVSSSYDVAGSGAIPEPHSNGCAVVLAQQPTICVIGDCESSTN